MNSHFTKMRKREEHIRTQKLSISIFDPPPPLVQWGSGERSLRIHWVWIPYGLEAVVNFNCILMISHTGQAVRGHSELSLLNLEHSNLASKQERAATLTTAIHQIDSVRSRCTLAFSSTVDQLVCALSFSFACKLHQGSRSGVNMFANFQSLFSSTLPISIPFS